LERKKMQLRSYSTKFFIAGWISNETFARGSNSTFFPRCLYLKFN
jgi:hypothetical protein